MQQGGRPFDSPCIFSYSSLFHTPCVNCFVVPVLTGCNVTALHSRSVAARSIQAKLHCKTISLLQCSFFLEGIYPDLMGIRNYFTRWVIRINSYNVNRTKRTIIKKCNTEAPPLNLTSMMRKQIALKHTNKIIRIHTNWQPRKIVTNSREIVLVNLIDF